MKQGIGFSATINIIAIFIVVTFAFLAATLSYYKAYKINNAISSSIEKYEGYNSLAKKEISTKLGSLGYRQGSTNCKNTKVGNVDTTNDTGYDYCIKYIERTDNNYYKYEITTYLNIDIPLGNLFLKIPVKSTTEKIYYFNE